MIRKQVNCNERSALDEAILSLYSLVRKGVYGLTIPPLFRGNFEITPKLLSTDVI